ncbi:hypothetical protein EDM57_04970 [Brevibacillus gelatini]|uniref:Uncharacterized protein n=1 Tax=Brevibacillus gelatini TaxID=1655277 RepID=A0A3M8B7R5_9BACL|nr:hypothetical protein [Brevibacillus gelatini]RNB59494.1 hypothetical protein EDM57_04970 [Brevibacillus gelatini]
MDKVIQFLLENGFVEDGQTKLALHGVETAKEQGRIAVIGGRARFRNLDWFATVGKRTTCIYKKVNGEIIEMENFNSRDLNKITEFVISKIQ